MDHHETHSMDDLPQKNSWEAEDHKTHPEDREEDHPEDREEDHPEDQEEDRLAGLEGALPVGLASNKDKHHDPPISSLAENLKYLREIVPKLRSSSLNGTYSSELTTQTQQSKTPIKEA